jgi:hypothetical protein
MPDPIITGNLSGDKFVTSPSYPLSPVVRGRVRVGAFARPFPFPRRPLSLPSPLSTGEKECAFIPAPLHSGGREGQTETVMVFENGESPAALKALTRKCQVPLARVPVVNVVAFAAVVVSSVQVMPSRDDQT